MTLHASVFCANFSFNIFPLDPSLNSCAEWRKALAVVLFAFTAQRFSELYGLQSRDLQKMLFGGEEFN